MYCQVLTRGIGIKGTLIQLMAILSLALIRITKTSLLLVVILVMGSSKHPSREAKCEETANSNGLQVHSSHWIQN